MVSLFAHSQLRVTCRLFLYKNEGPLVVKLILNVSRFFVVVLRLRLTVVCLICFSFGREKDISNLISNSYFQKEDLLKQAPGRD